jgi:hypothetical protein
MREVPWLLEELCVSHFARHLGAVSGLQQERIRRILDEAVSARRGR